MNDEDKIATVAIDQFMTDIIQPHVLEIKIRRDGKVVWVNADELCWLRACRIEKLIINDERRKSVWDIILKFLRVGSKQSS